MPKGIPFGGADAHFLLRNDWWTLRWGFHRWCPRRRRYVEVKHRSTRGDVAADVFGRKGTTLGSGRCLDKGDPGTAASNLYKLWHRTGRVTDTAAIAPVDDAS